MMTKKLIVLFGQGGLSDVGRHAILAALEKSCSSVTVLTQHPELLDEPNWKSGGPDPKTFAEGIQKNVKIVKVNEWGDKSLEEHFSGMDAVVSCLGNRQATFMGVPASSWCANEANEMVIRAMKAHNIRRVVAVSSMGIEEDWPPMEFYWAGKIMSLIFILCARRAYKDLTNVERAYRKSGLDYLLVRPLGLSEELTPTGEWKIQGEKYKDTDIDINVAKMDCARFMVQEALNPERHEDAVVIGGVKTN